MRKRNKNVAVTGRGSILQDLILIVTLTALVFGCFAIIVSTRSSISQKERELAEIQQKKAELDAENGELERLLSEEDLTKYMELIAIDELNYGYPNERRFYDTSRD